MTFSAYPVGTRIQAAANMPHMPTLIEAREYGTIAGIEWFNGEHGEPMIGVKWDRPHDGLADFDNTTWTFEHETFLEPIPLYRKIEKAPKAPRACLLLFSRVPERWKAVATLALFFGLGWVLEDPMSQAITPLEAAVEFKDAKLLNTIVQRGQPLRALFTIVQRSECHGTVERVFTSTNGGRETSWRETLVYHNMPAYIYERLVVMHLPSDFLPGHYIYHSAGLVTCDDGVKYVIDTKRLPFEIVE